METKSIPIIEQDGRNKLSQAGLAGAQGGGSVAEASYRKFSNQYGKVYIPVINLWTKWTGRRMRYSRKVFKRAKAAADHSLAVGNRYIKFITYCKEAEREEVRTEES